MSKPQPDNLHAMRHSLAHIMAYAVQTLWPDAKFGVGPVVENGFYYDIDLGSDSVSEDDFKRIEKSMQQIIGKNYDFEQYDLPVSDAVKWAEQAKQQYKKELLNDLMRAGTTSAKDIDASQLGLPADASKVDKVSFYKCGEFTDLCRGPHVASTGKVGAFKLMRVAGAYWRGQEGNPQMQRLYGIAFATKDELNQHLNMLEEARKRDHRKLGTELDLFVISNLVGAGLPLFTPRGTVLREELGRYTQELRSRHGFERVWTPVIAKTDLYKASGHWDKFGDELFLVKSQETSDEFVLRPMNCPHHIQIFASQPRSYKNMPIKLMENAGDYRDEKTGELHGLSRVRSFTQDDSHAFVRSDQIKQVAAELVESANEMYARLEMSLKFRLSFRDDGSGYLGDPKLWDKAQDMIKQVAEENNLDYFIEEGEAAFYGPKIDFMATDAIGREWQVATVQLDFVQPERFELEYTDETGSKQRPVMIHCALLGSIERFLSVYIEHTAGKFPVWVAPEQVRIASVNQEPATLEFVEKLRAEAVKNGLRVVVDNANESVGKKIRGAEKAKVPYMLVVGQKEIETGQITPRIRADLMVQEPVAHPYVNFFKSVANEAKARVSRSSL